MSYFMRRFSSLLSCVFILLKLPSLMSSVLINTNLFSNSPTISSPSVWISISLSLSAKNFRYLSRSLLISCAAWYSFSSDWYLRYNCSYSLFFSEMMMFNLSLSRRSNSDSALEFCVLMLYLLLWRSITLKCSLDFLAFRSITFSLRNFSI